MEKVSNVLFKVGKYVLFGFFIILFLAIIGSIFTLVSSFKYNPLEVPQFSEILATTEAINDKNISSENIEPYLSEFNRISKLYLSDYGRRLFLNKIEGVDEQYRMKYVQGLENIIVDVNNYCDEKKCNNSKYSSLFESTLASYDAMFARNILRKNVADIANKTKQIAAFSTFISSLVLFVLFLAVALLIRIEENTRKENEKNS